MMSITRNLSLRSIMWPSCLIIFILIFLPLQQCSDDNCLEEGGRFVDDGPYSMLLVSPGKKFVLGLFTLDDGGFNIERYLGIWYYNETNLEIVVWVANRDKPMLETNGSLILANGTAKLVDANHTILWSTKAKQFSTKNAAPELNDTKAGFQNELIHVSYIHTSNRRSVDFKNLTPPAPAGQPSSPVRQIEGTRLCLGDDGNLVLKDRSLHGDPILWQSFGQPTDTFLPGMMTPETESLTLTSWQSRTNPAQGNFKVMLQPGTANEFNETETGGIDYWRSGPALTDLIGMKDNNSLCNARRIVMNFTGQLQFWYRDCEKGWSLIWSQPKDVCSLYNKCGNFGTCNSNNGIFCKCLPGFKPTNQWKSGDTSGGCIPVTGNPSQRNDSSNDTFLRLPMMKVNQTCKLWTGGNCEAGCLQENTCFAYYYGISNCTGTGNSNEKRCYHWTDDLADLQEEYADGITLNLRTRSSDIDSTSRGCEPCGTSVVPYPLSTAENCGDLSYYKFHCNTKTGQMNFSTPTGSYKVTLIDQERERFFIQVVKANSCDSRYIDSHVFSPKHSLPFNVINCNVIKNQPLINVEQPFIEVEMGWQPAPEFSCKADQDCGNFTHTSCKSRDGILKCICGSGFHWDSSELKCTKVAFPTKIVVASVAGALTITLLCAVFSIYHFWKRKIAKRQDHFEFQGDDAEGIDVPFFEWGSIVAATNNFEDANKLGRGGFGSVHRGMLPDGKEIAVKRLSTVSVQGIEEFRTEVVLIAKLQHRNLVRLLGYCVKEDEKILVYEYMPNGSLDSCLFDESHPVQLDWERRSDIVFGIARGLLYLHQDSRLRIIHRDLKPSNILLDQDLNPKISDFGIARIVEGKEAEASTAKVVGTYGYMSPEYAYEGIFSVKSDVFSFGVVVLETISGRRNSRTFVFEHGISLLGHAWRLWNEDRGMELVDQKIKESCNQSEVLKCIHVGLLCVQEDPSDRSTMSTVVLMLNSENASLPAPKQPAFSTRKPPLETASSSSAADSSQQDVMTVSTVGR